MDLYLCRYRVLMVFAQLVVVVVVVAVMEVVVVVVVMIVVVIVMTEELTLLTLVLILHQKLVKLVKFQTNLYLRLRHLDLKRLELRQRLFVLALQLAHVVPHLARVE